jgi:hypothetical protein
MIAGIVLAVAGTIGRHGRTETPRDANSADHRFAQLDPRAEPNRPQLEFPHHVRSKDKAVNTFIEEFYQACYLGDYDTFRLMMSTRVDPFTPERFKKALQAVEQVRIDSVEELPVDAEVPPPIYLVRSHIRLRADVKKAEHEKTIAILVFKETGRWVMAPAPQELRDGLDALDALGEEDDKDQQRPGDEPWSMPAPSTGPS